MSDANATIRINIDSSQAQSQLKGLAADITRFQSTLATSTAAAQKTVSDFNARPISRAFTAEMVPVINSVQQFSKALENNKLTLGEYTRFAGSQMRGLSRMFSDEYETIEKTARQRVKQMEAQYVSLGRTAKGTMMAMQMTPTGLASGYSTDMAVATQRAQIFNKLIDDGSTKLVNLGKNTQWAGRQLTVGISVPLAALGAVAAKTFMELDKASTSFERVYGDLSTSRAEMERNKTAVMELGMEYTKYGVALKDTIELSARVAATGLQNEEMLAATEQTLRLATLGQMGYNEALDATISMQSAFGIQSKDLAENIDYLNAVENQTVLTIQDMAAAIPRVAPVIKGLGGDVKDLAAMLTAMREGGVSAEQGANALKSGLASLINPTDRAQATLQKLGINMSAIISENRGDLLATVQAFGKALSVVDDFGKQQALEQIFGKYQYARMSALFTNIASSASQASKAIDLTNMSVSELAMLSEKELGQIEESTTVKFQAAIEKLKAAIAPLGEAFLKAIMPIAQAITTVAEGFNNLADPVKNTIFLLVAAIAVFGPIVQLLGTFYNALGNVVKMFQFFRKAIATVRGDGKNFAYLAQAEGQAVAASEALEASSTGLTQSLLLQKTAVRLLSDEYERYARAAGIASSVSVARGAPARRMANGGQVPGTGNKDTVPALLTPGEMVVTKEASKKYAPIIAAMNAGTLPGYEGGLDDGLEGVRGHFTTPVTEKNPEEIKKLLEEGIKESKASGKTFSELEGILDDLNAGKKVEANLYTNAITDIPKMANVDAMTGTEFGNMLSSSAGRARMMDPFIDQVAKELGTSGTALRNNPDFMRAIDGMATEIGVNLAQKGGNFVETKDFNNAFNEAIDNKIKSGALTPEQAKAVESTRTRKTRVQYRVEGRKKGGRMPIAGSGVSPYPRGGLAPWSSEFLTEEGNAARVAKAEESAARAARYSQSATSPTGAAMIPQVALEEVQVDEERVRSKKNEEDERKKIIKEEQRQKRLAIKESDKQVSDMDRIAAKRKSLEEDALKDVYSRGQKDKRQSIRSERARIARINDEEILAMVTADRLKEEEAAVAKSKRDSQTKKQARQERRDTISAARRSANEAERKRNLPRTPVDLGMPRVRTPEATEKQSLRRRAMQRMGRSSPGLGIGLGMASMLPMMMQNEQGKVAGIDADTASMGIGVASLLAMLPGPLMAVGAAAGVAGLALKVWRNNVDDSARAAAQFGANVGGTANALNNMASMLGKATPAQRQAQMSMSFSAEEQTAANEQFQSVLDSESGQKFIEDLKNATSADRFKILSDYVKNGIASGIMDQEAGQLFTKTIASALGDAVLGSAVMSEIKKQQAGSEAMLALAEQRASAVQETAAMAKVASDTTVEEGDASQVIGSSIQVMQDFANASALAQEEYNSGTITFEQLRLVVDASREAQEKYTFAIQNALMKTEDFGATMQAWRDQLTLQGMTEEQIGILETAAKPSSELVSAYGEFGKGPLSSGTFDEAAKTMSAQMIANMQQALANGMSAANIAGILNTVNADPESLAAKVYSENASIGRGIEAAGLATNVQAGAVPGISKEEDVAKYVNVGIKFSETAGTMEQFQAFINSIPEEKRVDILVDMQGMSPEAQALLAQTTTLGTGIQEALLGTTQYKQATEKSNVGLTGVAARAARASGYDVAGDAEMARRGVEEQKALNDAAARAKEQFGEEGGIELIINSKYSEDGKELTAEQLAANIIKVADTAEFLKGVVDQELLIKMGIDTNDPEQMAALERYKEDIPALAGVLKMLPEDVQDWAANIAVSVVDGEDKPLEAAELLKKGKAIQKALKDIGSKNTKVKKEAIVTLVQSTENAQGEAIDRDQALNYYDQWVKDFGDKNVKAFTTTTITQLLVVESEIEGAQAAYDQAKAAFIFAELKGMDTTEYAKQMKAAAALVAAGKAKRETVGTTPPLSSGGEKDGGSGDKKKTLLQEMKANLKMLTDQYDAVNALMKGKSKDFKGVMSGPFAPEFIEYLKSQGARGTKLLKEQGAKFTEAYRTWVKTQLQEGKNAQQMMAGLFRNQAVETSGKTKAKASFAAAGWNPETTDQYFSTLKPGTFAVAERARREREKLVGKEFGKNFNKIKDYEDLTKKQKARVDRLMSETDKIAISLTTPSKKTSKEAMGAQYRAAQEQIQPDLLSAQNVKNLTDLNIKGLTPEIAQKLNDIGATALMSKKQIRGLIDELNLLGQAEWDAKPITERTSEMLSAQQSILDIKRQIEELNLLKPEQDLLETMQKANEELGRTIELRQRDLEPIDEAISKLEEEKTKINEIYDERLKALDQIEKANQRIYDQQRGQLSIAQALSVGDVAGAAKAMQDLQQQMAQGRQQETRDALENARAAQLAVIDKQINDLKDRRKVIEEDIKNLQKQQRVNADAIYLKQKSINTLQDSISKKYDNQALKLATLNNELAIAEAHWAKISSYMGTDGAAAGTVTTVPGSSGSGGSGGSASGADTNSFDYSTIENRDGLVYYKGTATLANGWAMDTSRNQKRQYIYGKPSGTWVPMKNGGLVKKYAVGGMVPGFGSNDTVPAMLTPGEFVIRKPVAQQFGSALSAMNSKVFPNLSSGGTPLSANGQDAAGSMQYNYEVNVNVAGTNASPDEIANVVMSKIKMTEDRKIRSYKF